VQATRANRDLTRVDARGLDRDQDCARHDDRVVDLADLQHVNVSVPVEAHRPHVSS
jgi:hypothetical protein